MTTEEKSSPMRPILKGCAIATGIGLLCTIFLCAGFLFFEEELDQFLETDDEQEIPTAVADIPIETETETPLSATEQASPTAVPTQTENPTAIPTNTPMPTSTPSALFTAEDLPADIESGFITDVAQQNLATILGEPYPEHDYYEAQIRYIPDDSLQRSNSAVDYALGDSLSVVTEEIEVALVLMGISDNAYFWADERLSYTDGVFDPITAEFESVIYPTLLEYYGQESRPGVDGSERMHLIHLAETATNDEFGYFEGDNGYPAGVFPWSNEIDAVFMNMSNLDLEEDYYYATLAHEIQHLIHWGHDSNENSWVDEGVAQLVEHILGYQTFDVDLYTDDPNFQFNVWSSDADLTDKNYSASALFFIYFWEQLGDQAVRDLVEQDLNGLSAVQDVLATYRPEQSLDQFVSAWYVANYSNNQLDDALYSYDLGFPSVQPSVEVWSFPYEETETLQQMGARYFQISESGSYTVSFAANTEAETIPSPPNSSGYLWYAPQLDGINSTLYRQVDLSGLSEATLMFDTWYDLEVDYDLVYISVSEDGGESWTVLEPNNSATGWYGFGLNGRSADLPEQQNGWVTEAISLDRFTGQEILVSIDLFTDSGLTQAPFAVTNLQISGIDAEPDDSLWDGDGFVYITPALPQNWSVQIIINGEDGRVETVPPNPYNQHIYSYTAPAGSTIVIAPITSIVQDEAAYWLQITR